MNPDAWWAASLMAALVVRTGTQRYERMLERRYVRTVGVLAVAWLSLAWQLGPYRPELDVPLAAGAPLFAMVWAVYRRLRRLPTIDWPRARVTRAYARELRSALRLQLRAARQFGRMGKRWPWTSRMRQVNLPNSALVGAHWNPSGPAWVRLELGSGKTLDDVRLVVGALETEWRLRPGSLRPKRADEGLAHEVVLEFRSVAEMAPPPAMLPWPAKPPRRVTDPVRLGEFSGRRPVLLPLINPKDGRLAPHVQVTGQTGWGKGSFVNCLLAETALLAEVEHWGVDAKGGIELSPWATLFRELAIDGDEAIVLLERATAEMKRRWGVLRAAGRRFWVPSAAEPLVIFVVDEWGVLPTKAKDLLDVLLAQARATGIWFLLCTQRASAAKTGGSGQTGDAKSQLGLTVSYYMLPGDEELSFGDGAKRAGWRTDLLDRPGLAYVRWQGVYDSPDRWQTYWVDDAKVAEVAALAAAARGSRPLDEGVATEGNLSVRPLPPPAEPTTAAEPGRPALHLVDPATRLDPLDRLLELLDAAPEEGVERAELVRMTGMSDSWVAKKLEGLRDAGKAVRVARARWRRAGIPSVVAMRSS
jgi:biotin operon repressor